MDLRSRFGFHTLPFTREIRVSDRFALPFFDEAKKALHRTVERRMAGALIAPAGTGKSGVLRALAADLPEARYRVHYVKVTGLSKRDMCREIAACVGLGSTGSYPRLVRRLQERFKEMTETDGLHPVLILDEAHDLRPGVLGMLRILTNFEMDSRLVVSVVLAGQPFLGTMLRRDELEDMARRIAHYTTLRTLSREETLRYIAHRCTIAGAKAVPFDKAAQDAIFEIGRGNLRAASHLALKALEMANDAEDDVVSTNHIIEARKVLWA